MNAVSIRTAVIRGALVLVIAIPASAQFSSLQDHNIGKDLFEKETFGGNGRTCLTCHSKATGTVSPQDAQKRFVQNRFDPLFLLDGSDDGKGVGVRRMLTEATVLVTLPLPGNVSLADDPTARTVTLRRAIPSTLNTPALDPKLMLDGREPNLESQANSAIRDHAQATTTPSATQLGAIAAFQRSNEAFFSSSGLRSFAQGGPPPTLPLGQTDSEKRGRRFFEDIFDPTDLRLGSCAGCHSGPMLNQTNQFLPFAPPGTRFQSVGVSELNPARNPVRTFQFRNPDGSVTQVASPDPGRALITGDPRDANQFKISSLWGVRRTAPYFHDNSARTLEDLVDHYATFFKIVANLELTLQDKADIVAYLKLLD